MARRYQQNKQIGSEALRSKGLGALLRFDGIECDQKLCYIIIQIVLLYQRSNEVLQMLKNNIEVDVKIKCIEAGKTQAQLGEAIGTTGQYVNRIIKKGDGIINKTFVEMLDALGYDIELHYVKKEEV